LVLRRFYDAPEYEPNQRNRPTIRRTALADLHIRREHSLSLAAARKIALSWAEQVEAEFGMNCTYEKGAKEDRVTFTRSGVNGVLHVTSDHFDLDAKLGFLLGAFKGRIEAEIVKNLDNLLAPKAPKKAATKKQ
jgi:putative polyhydroxyalkanoate system protein